ncbi:hypothetical protein [Agrococcus sp. ARC_14]|uniref:hypothetical protein n=1 Tax=Agrococcus sp. ARC_14 TaxID=2919927 RepID=UPI001F068D07|nr:hypothetical protein [Agrococcus sp. ARC_14]MCH1882603.1 hypothetical protein [Agrococcus sp. ARC_14]
MAALLLGLRLRQYGRALGRNPWAIVTLVVTALGALAGLGLLAVLLVTLRVLAPTAAADAVVLLGSGLVVVWAVASILISADDALAPERFSVLPVPARRLLPGVLLAGAIGVGGIATAIALLLTLIGWSADLFALVAAVLLLPVQLLTCLLAGRALVAALSRQLAKRSGRDLTIVVGSLLGISAGILVVTVLEGVRALGSTETLLGALSGVLAWTPLGAAWGVPLAVLAGSWLEAVAKLAIAIATVVLLWLVWAHDFRTRLTAPIVQGGGGRVRGGAWLDRLLPATPVGAIAARGLRYRFRDPRHLVNVLGVAIVPLLVLVMNVVVGNSVQVDIDAGPGAEPFAAIGPMLLPVLGAIVLMSVAQLDAAYDSSAIAAHVLTGVTGAQDRAGRALGMVVLFAPILLVMCVLSTAIAGSWTLLPASIGATLGTGGIVLGIGAAVSPWLPGQTPPPETSPFGAGSSGGAQALLGALIAMAAILTVGAPAIGTAIAAAWIPWLGWVSLAIGIVVAVLAVWLGVRIGGRALERRWPELLAAVAREA